MSFIILHALGFTFGLVFLGYAITGVVHVQKLLKNNPIVTAKIVDFVIDEDSDGVNAINIICEFTDKLNQTHQATNVSDVNGLYYSKGDKVEIVYVPEHPQQIRLVEDWCLYGNTVFNFAAAWCFLIIDGCYFLSRWWLW